MTKLTEYFLNKPRVSNLILVLVVISGMVTASNVARQSYPATNLDLINITTAYPGASPEDVEVNITGPMEEELLKVENIDQVTSMSMENLSVVLLKLNVDAPNKQKVKNDIQNAVDRVTNLPRVAEKPFIYEIRSSNVPIIEISLSGGSSELELRQYAKSLESKLRSTKGVGGIEKLGYRKREIHVNADLELLKKYYVSLGELMEAIRAGNVRLSGGTLESYVSDKKIVTFSEYQKPLDVKNAIIRSTFTGNKVTISNVAEISEDFKTPRILYRANGKPCISLVITTQDQADVISLSENVREVLTEFQKGLPKNVKAEIMYDISTYTDDLITLIIKNGIIGFVLVLLVMFLFLDMKTAIWTALGIPIALAGAILFFPIFDLTLNLMSLMAIILVLGILVDDAIVIAENIYRWKEKGLPPKEATLEGVKEVFKPVSAAVFTTILAFVPMIFMGGMMGKFMFTLPAVVLALLGFSLIEATAFLPGHIMHGNIPQKQTKRNLWIENIISKYEIFIRKCLENRFKVLLATLLFFLTIAGTSPYYLKFLLMNQENFDIFHVIMETPNGTSLKKTSESVKKVEEIIDKNIPKDALQSYLTRIGHHTTNVYGTSAGEYSNWAMITVYLKHSSQRDIQTETIWENLQKEFKNLKDFQRIEIEYMNDGPPVGKPINIVFATDSDKLRKKFEKEAIRFLKEQKGIRNIQSTNVPGKDELRLILDRESLAKAGLTAIDVSQTVRTAFNGTIVTSIRRANEEIDYRIQLKDSHKYKAENILNLLISNREGKLLPLHSFGRFVEGKSPAVLHHFNGKRSVTVTSDLDTKVATPTEINQKVVEHFSKKIQKHPGLIMELGGEEKETMESLQNFAWAFMIALIAVYFLLVALFDSFVQPFLIMVAIPASIIGVILTFGLHGKPLDFLALVGILGLLGIVVNDTIVMISHMNNNVKDNENKIDSIVKAAVERFRPVVLTTLSTAAGLFPTAYGIGGDASFFTPMVLAMSWGLVFTTIFTLTLIPVLYSYRRIVNL